MSRSAIVQQKVNEALANSQENGYGPERQPAHELALDLITYDADLEHYPLNMVRAAAQNWLDNQQPTTSDQEAG